ncbi:MAG: hypothetical protein ACXVJ7_17105 [Acidimicrobiia bacterium]
MPRLTVFTRIARQLSGQGALDNVTSVLEARRAVDLELGALEARCAATPVAVEAPAAA